MLKLQNVVKNYGAFSLHCSLELKSGQISALIGQNGAGKYQGYPSRNGQYVHEI